MKIWIKKAIEILDNNLAPVTQEPNELDWKADLSPNKERLKEHISAFSNNAGGGFLVFGIKDTTGEIVGINEERANIIKSQLTNIARDGLNLGMIIEHSIETYQEKIILITHIKESPIKPVHIKGKSIEYAFVRSGGTTRKANRQEIGSLLMNSRSPRFELVHSTKLLDRMQVMKALDYKGIYKLLNRPIPDSRKELMIQLESENMIEIVSDDGYYITNLGALTAAEKLDDFSDLARKNIRLIKYKGLNKVETERELTGNKGYAIGFSGLMGVLKIILPRSEVIKDAIRANTTIYPEIALRELIANAIIHQDLSITNKGPIIEIFDNRIAITSPGRLLPSKKIDRLIGTPPESRNEILAKAFRRYNICEERGSGFEKVISAIELYGLPPIHFEEGENYFRVTLFAPKLFIDMPISERIEACYQHAIIQYLTDNTLTNKSLRRRFKMHDKKRVTISKLINQAVEKRVIKPKNPDNLSSKYAEYIPYWV